LGVSALEVGTDLLRGGLDCGNKIVVREGVFGDKFVGRDGMVFVVLIYVQATEGHGEKKGDWTGNLGLKCSCGDGHTCPESENHLTIRIKK